MTAKKKADAAAPKKAASEEAASEKKSPASKQVSEKASEKLLDKAVERPTRASVDAALAGAGLERVNGEGLLFHVCATGEGALPLVEHLLAAGADPNAPPWGAGDLRCAGAGALAAGRWPAARRADGCARRLGPPRPASAWLARRLAPDLLRAERVAAHLRILRTHVAAGFLATKGTSQEAVARSVGYGSTRAPSLAFEQEGLPPASDVSNFVRAPRARLRLHRAAASWSIARTVGAVEHPRDHVHLLAAREPRRRDQALRAGGG